MARVKSKISSPPAPDGAMKKLRDALGWTQAETAHFLGISKKAVESYEQGWRNPPQNICKQMMTLLAVQRGYPKGYRRCWELMRCSPAVRDECFCARRMDGYFCWLTCHVNKHRCIEGRAEPLACCLHCPVVQHLLQSERADAPSGVPAEE